MVETLGHRRLDPLGMPHRLGAKQPSESLKATLHLWGCAERTQAMHKMKIKTLFHNHEGVGDVQPLLCCWGRWPDLGPVGFFLFCVWGEVWITVAVQPIDAPMDVPVCKVDEKRILQAIQGTQVTCSSRYQAASLTVDTQHSGVWLRSLYMHIGPIKMKGRLM